MRFAFVLLALTLAFSAEAANKRQPANKRNPANRFPTKVYTIACRGEEADNVIAVIRVSLDLKDSGSGLASGTAYLREGRGYRVATLSGRYNKVAGAEVVLTMKEGFGPPYDFLLDPVRESSIPGFQEKQNCEITGQMDSQ